MSEGIAAVGRMHGAGGNCHLGRTISQLPAGTVQFTAPDELSSTCAAPVSRLTASTQMVLAQVYTSTAGRR